MKVSPCLLRSDGEGGIALFCYYLVATGEAVTCSRRVTDGVAMLVVLLLLVPATSGAADLNISSDTVVRMLERDDSNGKQRSLLPAYEFLQLDYGTSRRLVCQSMPMDGDGSI